MKKGISLIVLVITIIVMIIIAGAIILSLSDSNVMQNASFSTIASNRSSLQHAVIMKYGDVVTANGGEFITTTTANQDTLDAVIATENAKVDEWTITLEATVPASSDGSKTEVIYESTNTTAELMTAYGLTEDTFPTWMRGSDHT